MRRGQAESDRLATREVALRPRRCAERSQWRRRYILAAAASRESLLPVDVRANAVDRGAERPERDRPDGAVVDDALHPVRRRRRERGLADVESLVGVTIL